MQARYFWSLADLRASVKGFSLSLSRPRLPCSAHQTVTTVFPSSGCACCLDPSCKGACPASTRPHQTCSAFSCHCLVTCTLGSNYLHASFCCCKQADRCCANSKVQHAILHQQSLLATPSLLSSYVLTGVTPQLSLPALCISTADILEVH